MISDTSCIAELKQLKEAKLECTSEVDPQELVAAIVNCSMLHTLEMDHGHMTAVQLASLLVVIPRLHTLTLSRMGSLCSLGFLTSVQHLRCTLTSFAMYWCDAIPTAEVHHLHTLSALTHLELHHSFDDQLDKAVIVSLTPDTPTFLRSVWPNLLQFKYVPNMGEQESDTYDDEAEE